MKTDLILAFDTSAAHCAAALLSGPRIVTRVEMMAKGQAERLVPMLDEVLAAERVDWRDLDALVVGIGPGNFTGIRIAVALARGLALGLGIPAVGVTGFEALAFGRTRPLTVALEAPRGQAYVQVFGMDVVGPAEIVDTAPVGALRVQDVDVALFVTALAQAGQAKTATAQPRPAPFYLRSADAAPASDQPPLILP
ncbi:MAG: tRNA (adenosine(37)-N6)-threonylcarbamoyltransferase complex dimerization subunit type 1 TsaB [Candidatus Saccharibacteria bacterium]|nr:tRNA (adenosine(37)-N6)-threonylcarbamoyltransferase complex dimerization subunit type 1 TsaB [Pseudorhodobacter sp.]